VRALVYRLGWPLTFIGLVVVLAAILSFMIRDSELEREWLEVTSSNWRSTAGDAIGQQRARLTVWPGVLAGAGVTGLGILLLEIRRRKRGGGIERDEVDGRFDDDRPGTFRPPGDEPG
jgi:hypothetical protein